MRTQASHRTKVLFVCSQNRQRSLTAEHLYRGFPVYEVKSAGTSPLARVRIAGEHIAWADLIFAMEKKQQTILEKNFAKTLRGKRLICLDVPDIYYYMEPDLIEQFKERLRDYVQVPK